ncbi:MAG: ABC transporter ATP-binding protein [Pseudomonadota bacterium]
MIQSYRWIWALLSGPERLRLLMVMGLTLIMAVFELITVAGILPLLSILAEPGLVETVPALIWFTRILGLETFQDVAVALGISIFVLVLVGMAVRALVTYAQIRFALGRSQALATQLLHRHLAQDYVVNLQRNTAALSQSLLSEIEVVVRDSILPGVLLFSNVTILVLVGGFLFYAEPYVAAAAIALLFSVYGLAFLLLRGAVTRTGTQRLAANRERFAVVQEVTGSLKDIKVMGLERVSLARFRTPARQMARHLTLGAVMQRLPRYALEAMVYGGFVALILILVIVREGDLADLVPLLGLLAIAASRLFPALQQIYQHASAMRMSAPALERLHDDLMRNTVTAPLPVREGPRLPLEREIAFEDVGFAYPDAEGPATRSGKTPTLGPLSLRVPARSTVGIVGGTGAGKTTMIDLLLGLLRPTEGQISIDGVPLEGEAIRAWQRNIGYVPQSIFLSDASVARNIAFGLPPEEIDMARVTRAARLAKLHDFVVSELAEGYETPVGERGIRLSGGQRQRIGIARALYDDPGILVLDEATSALDTVTERAVMDAIAALGGHKTILLIAHRLSTVEACDKILVLERGELRAEGSYDALLAENDIFRRMVTAHERDR